MLSRSPEREIAWCGSCRVWHPLPSFRRLRDEPLLYCDFCQKCETRFGTFTLYRNHALTKNAEAAFIIEGGDATAKSCEQTAINARDEQQRELARRELMRRRLIYYVAQMRGPSYMVGWVHQDIARRLEKFVDQVEKGLSPRLMIFVPPRHGKSILASEEFPGWVLGKHPDWEMVECSYAESLPIGFSRRVRDRLDSPEYQVLFPNARIRSDARGVEEWSTTAGGRFRAAGVGGGITGTGAHILTIDDPIKDYEQAQSVTIREAAYNWYTTTAKTRLAPGGGVLVIQTRWHDADLAGRLLTDMKELRESGVSEDEIDQWEVVTYPALAEHDEYLFPGGTIEVAPSDIPDNARLLRRAGEALHPARYTAKALRTLRNTMPGAQWNALYQQNPVPDSGEYFTRDQFRTYASLPGKEEDFSYFMAWDLAIGQKQTNDWTVGVVGALHYTGRLYVVDMVRGRLKAGEIVNAMVAMGKKWPYIQRLGIEEGHIKKTMQGMIEDAVQQNKLLFSLDNTLRPDTDKMRRARPLQEKMQTANVFFPVQENWATKAMDEMLRFPSGVNDDIVDAMAWLVIMSKSISAPMPKNFRSKRESWKKKLDKMSTGTTRSTSFMTA
jgi:predicted phage terminase large subunit-like protein